MGVLDETQKDLLKIRLGGKTIDPIRVSYCKQIGSRICVVGFVHWGDDKGNVWHTDTRYYENIVCGDS